MKETVHALACWTDCVEPSMTGPQRVHRPGPGWAAMHGRSLASLLVGVALVAAGCAGAAGDSASTSARPADRSFVVGYVPSADLEPPAAPFLAQLRHYVRRYPDLRLAVGRGAPAAQVRRLVENRVDALILASPSTRMVKLACGAGIPVVVMDRPVGTSCFGAYVHVDNYLIGRLAGRLTLRLVPRGGEVAELQGARSDPVQIARDRGFRDAIRSDRAVRLVERTTAGWRQGAAAILTRRLLRSHEDIDIVYAQNDAMALGAHAASAMRARPVRVIGTDGRAGQNGGIWAVQIGELAATFAYPTGAQQAAAAAQRLVHHHPVAKNQVLGVVEVTAGNAAALYRKYGAGWQTMKAAPCVCELGNK